jgi:hypothetical protein
MLENRKPYFCHYLKTTLLILICLFLASEVYAENEFHLSNEFSVTYNDVTGPGNASSSLTEGVRYLNVLGMNGNGKIRGFDYNFNIGAKATDDSRNDPMTISLTNLQGRISNKIHTMNIGDTFESFSQYSLSTALKGASYRFYDEKLNTPEITLVYGLAYPRWDNVWREHETRTIERQAYGGRIKYNFSSEFNVGLNIVGSEDDKRINATDTLYNNSIYSFDLEYRPIPGLTIRSESAFNETKISDGEGDDYDEEHGYAYKVEAVGDGGPSRVSIEYEKVSPDFQTLLGSATPDREKVKAKWRYKYNKNISINTGFLWFRNNLDGQRAFTTHNYKPEAGITVKKLFNRQYSAADFSYKYDRKYGDGTSTTDHITNFNYRDRFGIFDSETNLGYTVYDTETNVRDSREYTYNTTVSSRHTVDKLILKPTLYLGGWTASDELADTKDTIYEYSLGLGIDIPHMKITSNFKAGLNRLDKEAPGTNDSRKAFGNMSIYYRPAVLAKLNQGMLFLRANINDFAYTTGSRDFRETSVTSGLNIQF